MVFALDVSQETTVDQPSAVAQSLRTVSGQPDKDKPINQFRTEDHATIHFQPQSPISHQILDAIFHVIRLKLLASE